MFTMFANGVIGNSYDVTKWLDAEMPFVTSWCDAIKKCFYDVSCRLSDRSVHHILLHHEIFLIVGSHGDLPGNNIIWKYSKLSINPNLSVYLMDEITAK